MADPLLDVRGLIKRFGGVVASDRLDLEVAEREVHAVIGPNGAGKTTLVGEIAGEVRPDSGRILLAGRDVTGLPQHARVALGLARSFQTSSVFPAFTARDNVALAAQARDGHSFRFWRPVDDDRRLRTRAEKALEAVGLGDRADAIAGALSHGERRQLEVAMALAQRPRLLLLDEPMAGLGTHESRRMIDLIGTLKGMLAILLIEHDMDAVFSLADRVTVLVYGRAIASGTPEAIRANPTVRDAYLGEEA